jgi:glycosyltransferase involved in cell wall biosynthesis
LLGFLDEREVPIWFNASDIFLLSSLHEGNPTVMFEALGCGRPFIGTNVGGIPEVIVNSRLGLLSNPANSDELAKVILKSFKKKWDYNYIHNYAKRFTWKNISKQIIHVYKRCLNE